MARNIFSIHELSILLKLSILFVGKVKITPFNGSIFLMAPGHFYVVPVKKTLSKGMGSLHHLMAQFL